MMHDDGSSSVMVDEAGVRFHHNTNSSTSKPAPSSSSSTISVVFIKGFLTDKDVECNPKELVPPNAKVYCVYPSSVGSIHDRVCEVFYELVGGRVDYGEEHSRFHGHDRYGRHFHCADSTSSTSGSKGLLSQWDEDHPIIVIGHSFGGLTAYALQTYLEEKRFVTHPHTSHRWIKGIITVGSAFNGSLRMYMGGLHLAYPRMAYWGSVGHILVLWIQLWEYFRWPCCIKKIHEFDQSFWKFHSSCKHSLLTILLAFAGYGIHCTTDTSVADSIIESATDWSKVMITYPDTYYYAISGVCTEEEMDHDLFHSSFPTRSLSIHQTRRCVKASRPCCSQQVAPLQSGTFDTKPWLYSQSDGMFSLYATEFPKLNGGRGDVEHTDDFDDGDIGYDYENDNSGKSNSKKSSKKAQQCSQKQVNDNIHNNSNNGTTQSSNNYDDGSGTPIIRTQQISSFTDIDLLLQPGVWNYSNRLSMTHNCITSPCQRLWSLVWYICQTMEKKASSAELLQASSVLWEATNGSSQRQPSSMNRRNVSTVGSYVRSTKITQYQQQTLIDKYKPHCRTVPVHIFGCHRVGSDYHGAWSPIAFLITWVSFLFLVMYTVLTTTITSTISDNTMSTATTTSSSWMMISSIAEELLAFVKPVILAILFYFVLFRSRMNAQLTTCIIHIQLIETALLLTRLFGLVLVVTSISGSSTVVVSGSTILTDSTSTSILTFAKNLVWSTLLECFVNICFFLDKRQYTLPWHKVLSLLIIWQVSCNSSSMTAMWSVALGSHMLSQLVPLFLWIACSLRPAEHWSFSAISWGWMLLVVYWLLCVLLIVSLCSLFSLWLAAHSAFVSSPAGESIGSWIVHWIVSLLGWYGVLGLAYNTIDSYSFGLCYVLIKKDFHHERYREATEAANTLTSDMWQKNQSTCGDCCV